MAWLRRRAIVWFLHILKSITQGQGWVQIDVGYDSALGEETCRVTCTRERDGHKFDHRFYDFHNAAVVIDDLSRNRIRPRPVREQGGAEEE